MFESRQGRSINPNKRVRVYRNLHRSGPLDKPIYSVLQDGLVVGYVDAITVTEAKFIVSAAGRDKVRRTGKKVVHAFVEGRPAMYYLSHTMYSEITVHTARYNPRHNDSFVNVHTAEPVFTASMVQVGPGGVQYAV